MTAKNKFDLEKSLAQLEELVEELESGDLPLEKAMQKFEDGIKLTKILEGGSPGRSPNIVNIQQVDDFFIGAFPPSSTPLEHGDLARMAYFPRALSLDIDRQLLMDTVMYSVNVPAYSITPSGTLGY